jgi:hypothetical protein
LGRFEFESRIGSVALPFTLDSFGESRLLISWSAGSSCGMACSDEDHDRSMRADVEDQRWSHRSGTRWSGDRGVGCRCVPSAPCM